MDADNGRTGEMPADEAALRLGISKEALRKRISRGTVPARKVGGIWLVTLDAADPGRTVGRTDTDKADDRPSDRPGRHDAHSALVARLESENTFLRQQIERQTHIIAGLIQRIPDVHELGTGEMLEAAVSAPEPPGRVDTLEMTADTLQERHEAPVPASEGLWQRLWRAITGGG